MRIEILKKAFYILIGFPYVAGSLALVAYSRLRKRPRSGVVFGVSPLISNVYWSQALRTHGVDAQTWMTSTPSILSRDSFDLDFSARWGRLAPIRMSMLFLKCLLNPTTIFTTCEGFLLGQSVLWRLEAPLLKMAGSKVVVIPYGADSYVYRSVHSSATAHVLQLSYPDQARKQDRIARQVRYWVRRADIFIPGTMFLDGFGRADLMTPSPFCIDTEHWRGSQDGTRKTPSKAVVVTHSPNHRGFKGTEFIIQAIQSLKAEGVNVDLVLLENRPNAEVREILLQQSDIHVEQVIADGYAFNAIEAMAAGLPVISNLSTDEWRRPLELWSYLGECPIVSATPETIKETIRELTASAALREKLGAEGRAYVMRWHSYEAFVELYYALEEKLADPRYPLMDLYRPAVQ